MYKINSAFLISASVLGLFSCSRSANKNTKQPNILLIVTDDHSTAAISSYGSKLIETPNIDRLANEGILFENCYATNSISGPSRACILTGKFSHLHGFTDNAQTFDGNQQTFPKILQKAGYQTAIIGKWHLNSEPQGFDYWSVLKAQGEYYQPLFVEKDGEKIVQGYATDVITDKSIDFLKNRDLKKPFLLLSYHKAPHRSWMPALRHLRKFQNTVFPEPETLFDDYNTRSRAAYDQEMELYDDLWIEEDLKILSKEELEKPFTTTDDTNANKVDVKSANNRNFGINRYRASYSRLTESEKKEWYAYYKQRIEEYSKIKKDRKSLIRWKYQQYMRDYCATIAAVDENIGKLISYLEKTGELDNTIIVYTSDQGFFLGEHGWFDKRFMYEESMRMPFIVRFPKAINAGTRTKALAMNIDLAPTFIDYAGVKTPIEIQGMSLRPILESKGIEPENWRKEVYYHYYEYPSWHSVKRHYGIRTNRYKLIHFYYDIDSWELYDLEKDPYEINNIINNPAYTKIKEELMYQLQQTQQKYKDTDPNEKNKTHFEGANAI